MNSPTVKSLLKENANSQMVFIKGWVKTFRANRFISLNDGSCSENIQCVVDFENTDEKILSKINTGASIKIEGLLKDSLGKGQKTEIKVTKIEILGECDVDSYPIQPKKHSLEFLRDNAHLRVRTNTFSSIMRIRSNLSFAIHKYFKEKGFFYVNTPIITGSDAEGAGEMFKVTTLDINKSSLDKDQKVNYNEDFFGKETNLTVSGQLEAESLAMGLGKVYTFGPTFRAENSNTSRHLAEFWMIEPEMAFYDLSDNMNLAGALKDDDVNSFSDFFRLTDVEEAITPYGAQNAQQRSMKTKQQNANRRANNAQQDANRDATAKGREIAGNNKQRTGVPSPPPPTDVRGMNTNNINSNSAEIGRNREELERLKQLAFGRR